MFWETIAVEENSLQTLLKNEENLTFDAVLSDPFTLQELRSGNQKLILFITQPENLVKIVSYALSPELSDTQEYTEQYKYAHLCSEILTVRNNDFLINAFLSCAPAIECLKTNIDSMKLMNHLVASFFMKVIVHILQKKFDMCLHLFRSTNFLEKCVNNMHLGAIGELLQNISKVPSSTDEINAMKQYLVDEQLARRLVNILDPSLPKAVHDNAADLYIDLIRSLRDILYTCTSNDDILHDSLFTPSIVNDLVEKMLTVDKGEPNRSLLINCSDILFWLLETNCIMFCPSHIIENEDNGNEMANSPNGDSDHKETVLDNKRVVETILAKHAGEIMKRVINELENEEESDCWLYLMRLLLALCNTNNHQTHIELCEGMKSSEFHKVFSFIYKYPMRTLLHRLVHKIVVYALYSNTGETISPLVSYFLEDCGLFKILINGGVPPHVYPRMQFISLRAFHIYLGQSLQLSLKRSPVGELLTKYTEDNDWIILDNVIQNFDSWNKPENERRISDLSCSDVLESRHDFIDDPLSENLREFEKLQSSKKLPSIQTDIFESHDIKRIIVEHDTFPDIENVNSNSQSQAFEDLCKVRDVSAEIKFDDLCTMRSVGIEDWPCGKVDEEDDWFARSASNNTSLSKSPPQDDFLSSALDWPSTENNDSKSSNDCWADFSSSKNTLSSPVAKNSLATDDDWPSEDTSSPPEMFQVIPTLQTNGE
ncbi:unnamed protein product [Auanema sp. JU1783]|nr:unnamed protein product [Auanema sp. JU1783]